jgi:phosphohistidine phosphatase
MNLYILRHGLAVVHGHPDYESDADRPLTPEGEAKLSLITKAMEALDLSFDVIVSSPFVRARQTAEIVAEAFKVKLQFSETLIPGGSAKQLIEFINRLAPPWQDIMVVGHEPYLSELISLLVSGNPDFSINLKKGGLCKLSASSLKHGRCATLEWLLTPKQMGLMK